MMGLICSCFGYGHQVPDHANPTSRNVVNMYKWLFHRVQVVAAASSNEAADAAAAAATATDTEADDMQPAVQTSHSECSMFYDSQLDGQLVQTQNKASAQTASNNVQSQRKSDVQPVVAEESEQTKVKQLADFKDSSEISPLSDDDEDVCPTCLEEYDEENPKIMTQCNHHYHLACIFEWMERSTSCPICSKLMVFDQMT